MDNTAIVSVQEQKQLQLLNNGLITADRFINKNYLINISEQNIVPLDDYEKTTNSIRLFQIIKLVYDKTENINDKLISVYSALQNVDSSALLVINGNGRAVTSGMFENFSHSVNNSISNTTGKNSSTSSLAIARNKGDRFWAFILMAAAVLTALEATGITNWL